MEHECAAVQACRQRRVQLRCKNTSMCHFRPWPARKRNSRAARPCSRASSHKRITCPFCSITLLEGPDVLVLRWRRGLPICQASYPNHALPQVRLLSQYPVVRVPQPVPLGIVRGAYNVPPHAKEEACVRRAVAPSHFQLTAQFSRLRGYEGSGAADDGPSALKVQGVAASPWLIQRHAQAAPEKLALCRSAVSMMRVSGIAGTTFRSTCGQLLSVQGGEGFASYAVNTVMRVFRCVF